MGDKPGQALLDLRFLELEALLQFRAEEPAVRELLWQLWIVYAIYLCYQGRYEEALHYTNRLLEIPHDLSKACSAPSQVAVIKKATALLRPLEVPGTYRPRQTRAALSFLLAQQTQIVLPECQAWYWMYLGELFILEGAYEEAERNLVTCGADDKAHRKWESQRVQAMESVKYLIAEGATEWQTREAIGKELDRYTNIAAVETKRREKAATVQSMFLVKSLLAIIQQYTANEHKATVQRLISGLFTGRGR